MNARRLLLASLFGGLAGLAYDGIHVAFGVLEYAHPHFWGTSLWVFPEFALATLVSLLAVAWAARRWPLPPVNGRRMALDGALLAVGYVATGLLRGHPLATALALGALASISVITRKSKAIAILSALAAVAGPLAEALISATGFFRYVDHQPVPPWLPLLWVIAAGLVYDGAVLLGEVKPLNPAPNAKNTNIIS